MPRLAFAVFPILFAAISCRGLKLKEGPVSPTETPGTSQQVDLQPTEPAGEPIAQSEDSKKGDKGDKDEKEKVAPPTNIAGAYLLCELTKPMQTGATEAAARCALRDEKNNSKVDIKTRFASSSWSYELPVGSSLSVTITELLTSPEWHVSYSIQGTDATVLAAQIGAIKFSLDAQDAAGVRSKATDTTSLPFIQWDSLGGNPVPSQAAAGGTWIGTTAILYLCRLHTGNEILPGKLLTHYNDPGKSICYSITAAGNAIQSQSEDAQTLLVPNDVLLISQGTFDEYFEWVPAANGQSPANAFVTGLDAQGRPLYSCRGVQNDGALPADQTPGVLRPGATGCVHEFQLALQFRNNYQVLTWKASGTMKILARP
ncbi:DM9 repeat-containing protein [Oligoflexus tunisiensis]|uniref:DM9 repeat-containing protein n=1 Tax=Oligoflexus tunisiensis TaxID=708132 RepID=UPI00159EF57B|nr:DM9 repeat-containing protein [Oligoflexus tunisiensis]